MSDIDSKLLARQIDAYLAANAISKSEFTFMTGISTATLSQWRKGKYKPSQKNIEALEAFTNMPIEALLFGHPVSNSFDGETKKAPTTESERKTVTDEGIHIGSLYDRADEKDKMLTHSVLDKYEDYGDITPIPTKSRNPGGFVEIDVYDEPAAAGLGNYLDVPQSHKEQFPGIMVPKGTDFGVRISGDSMMPVVEDGSTVFVKHTSIVESKRVGIFVLNGKAFCKQLIVDHQRKEVRLHSFNPDYEDIIITASDDLRTIGQVL